MKWLSSSERRTYVRKQNRKRRRGYLLAAYKLIIKKICKATKQGYSSLDLNISEFFKGSEHQQYLSAVIFPRLIAYYFHKKHPDYFVKCHSNFWYGIKWDASGYIYISWESGIADKFNSHWFRSLKHKTPSLASEINAITSDQKSREISIRDHAEGLIRELEKKKDLLEIEGTLLENLKAYDDSFDY